VGHKLTSDTSKNLVREDGFMHILVHCDM